MKKNVWETISEVKHIIYHICKKRDLGLLKNYGNKGSLTKSYVFSD